MCDEGSPPGARLTVLTIVLPVRGGCAVAEGQLEAKFAFPPRHPPEALASVSANGNKQNRAKWLCDGSCYCTMR